MILLSGAETPIPWDVADEVTLWYRERGRTASLHWNAVMRCGEIRVKLLPGDPRLKGFQEGKLFEDFECFYLHYPTPDRGLVGYNLAELGASGLRNLMDKANLWSGTGEYASLQDALSAVGERNLRAQEAVRQAAEQAAGDNAREQRARVLEIPRTTAVRPARLAHATD